METLCFPNLASEGYWLFFYFALTIWLMPAWTLSELVVTCWFSNHVFQKNNLNIQFLGRYLFAILTLLFIVPRILMELPLSIYAYYVMRRHKEENGNDFLGVEL